MDKEFEQLWDKVYAEKRANRIKAKKLGKASKKLGKVISGSKFGTSLIKGKPDIKALLKLFT